MLKNTYNGHSLNKSEFFCSLVVGLCCYSARLLVISRSYRQNENDKELIQYYRGTDPIEIIR